MKRKNFPGRKLERRKGALERLKKRTKPDARQREEIAKLEQLTKGEAS